MISEGNDCNPVPQNSNLGYLLLEKCIVDFYSSSSILLDRIDQGVWVNVDVTSLSSQSIDDQEASCHRCNLCIQVNEPENGSQAVEAVRLTIPSASRFDGTEQDLACSGIHKRRKRGDAALLMGLALTCQDYGHVIVKSVRVAFLDDYETMVSREEIDGDKNGKMIAAGVATDNFVPRTVKLVMVISMPQLECCSFPRSIQQSGKNGKFCKPLPPATQLLLATIRSDWGHPDLEIGSEIPTGKALRRSKARKEQSLFPDAFSLEEVYKRIKSAYSALSFTEEADLASASLLHKKSTSIGLVNLPKDVLVDNFAPYLRARSLDALRCSCKYFHHSLRSVVPGLRLQLYTHQLNSLRWMRMRECRSLTEDDLLSPSALRQRLCDDGDPLRAVTGGAFVFLCPEQGAGIRLSQYTGEEVIIRPNKAMSRKVARGGLLCDDPGRRPNCRFVLNGHTCPYQTNRFSGLGKTITVFSLILQTLGLSTTHPKSDDRDDGIDSNGLYLTTADERIFREYWKEQVVAHCRGRAMNKLVSEFIKSDEMVDFFVHPVDPERDNCPDYYDVIKKPICFQDIRKKIDLGEYGDSFDLFLADVELCFT